MKLAKIEGGSYVFLLGEREKALFLELLTLYPVIPPAHYQISQSLDSAEAKERQRLLDEAVAEQRRANKQQLESLLQAPDRFQSTAAGYRLTLARTEIEWLFQVLNDIRVGSWLSLGSPDEKKGKYAEVTPQNGHLWWAMELCGYFQMDLLKAMDR